MIQNHKAPDLAHQREWPSYSSGKDAAFSQVSKVRQVSAALVAPQPPPKGAPPLPIDHKALVSLLNRQPKTDAEVEQTIGIFVTLNRLAEVGLLKPFSDEITTSLAGFIVYCDRVHFEYQEFEQNLRMLVKYRKCPQLIDQILKSKETDENDNLLPLCKTLSHDGIVLTLEGQKILFDKASHMCQRSPLFALMILTTLSKDAHLDDLSDQELKVVSQLLNQSIECVASEGILMECVAYLASLPNAQRCQDFRAAVNRLLDDIFVTSLKSDQHFSIFLDNRCFKNLARRFAQCKKFEKKILKVMGKPSGSLLYCLGLQSLLANSKEFSDDAKRKIASNFSETIASVLQLIQFDESSESAMSQSKGFAPKGIVGLAILAREGYINFSLQDSNYINDLLCDTFQNDRGEVYTALALLAKYVPSFQLSFTLAPHLQHIPWGEREIETLRALGTLSECGRCPKLLEGAEKSVSELVKRFATRAKKMRLEELQEVIQALRGLSHQRLFCFMCEPHLIAILKGLPICWRDPAKFHKHAGLFSDLAKIRARVQSREVGEFLDQLLSPSLRIREIGSRLPRSLWMSATDPQR